MAPSLLSPIATEKTKCFNLNGSLRAHDW